MDEQGERYTFTDEEKATVIRFFGRVEVDLHERCRYREFSNASSTKFFSFEAWEGDLEKSIGSLLYSSDVVAAEGQQDSASNDETQGQSFNGRNTTYGANDSYQDSYSNVEEPYYATVPVSSRIDIGEKIGRFAKLVLILIVVFAGFILIQNGGLEFAKKDHITEYLDESYNFTYVTSVTSDTSSQKAKVFRTDMTIERAVKDIIDNADVNISKISAEQESEDAEEEDGVGLQSDYEYAYVYTSEEGDTCVQVSQLKFVSETKQNAYHSRYRNYHYYRMWRSSSHHSSYTTYANSARQSSVSSRRSQGGGTSYGK